MTNASARWVNYSVIIPFYKAYRFFEATLASVLKQSAPPGEVLVIDDEASDMSRLFLEKFAGGTVRIISLPSNSGAANARNVGICNARNEWIAFQDSDDLWEADKIERQFEYLHEHPNWVGCHTGVCVFNEDCEICATYLSKPHELQLEHLLLTSHVTPPSLLIRRDILLSLGGMDTRFSTSEDYEFSLRLVKAGHILGFVPLPLVRVRRQHHGNLSSNWHKVTRNHLLLIHKHKDVFFHYRGPHVARRFLAKSIRESAGKLGGVSGRVLYQLGKVLDPSYLKRAKQG